MVISNYDFDNDTLYSSTYDSHRYWTFIYRGGNIKVSMTKSIFRSILSNVPKMVGEANLNVIIHSANNHWYDWIINFEIDINDYVLAKDSYFYSPTTSLDP